MSITRSPRPESDFYVLSKGISEDTRLSWAARGLLIFLLGKPDHWRVSVAHLVGETSGCIGKSSGRDGVYAILGELVSVGYIERSQSRQAGRLAEAEYIVSEIAKPPRRENPVTVDLPRTASPDTAKPGPADPTLVKTDVEQGLSRSEDGQPGAAAKPVKQPKAPKPLPEWVAKAKALLIPEWLPHSEWSDYVDHRLAVKCPMTERAAELAVMKLESMHSRGLDAIESIRQTVRSGKWTDLYEPKAQRVAQPGVTPREQRKFDRTREFSGDLVADRGLMPSAVVPNSQPGGGFDAITG